MSQPGKVVVIKVGAGGPEQGFPVTLEIAEEGKQPFFQVRHALPPSVQLFKQYETWQQHYYALGENTRWRWHRIIVPDQPQVRNVSTEAEARRLRDQVQAAGQRVEHSFDSWLEQPKLHRVLEDIIVHVDRSERLRLILETENRTLQRLPWHCWRLFERLPQAELVLAAPYQAEQEQILRSPLKVLAVLGLCEELDVENDLQTLHEQFPDAQIKQLRNPSLNHLKDDLFYQPWDVLLFAGHSSSGVVVTSDDSELTASFPVRSQRSQIYLGQTPVPIADLTQALTAAVRNGLKLAVFNSCDGLGLAQDVSPAQIPNVVAMREPIPDEAAQDFLRFFLNAFRSGEPFHLAVRHARERLQDEEYLKQYPQANWLPVIFQNPSAPSFRYRSQPRLAQRSNVGVAVVAGMGVLAIASLAYILRPQPQKTATPPPVEPIPLTTSTDPEGETASPKLLEAHISQCEDLLVDVTTADNVDVKTTDKGSGTRACGQSQWAQAAEAFSNSLKQKPNDPETRIYLENTQIFANDRSHYTVVTSVPIGSNPNVAQEMLRGVAQAQMEFNRRDSGDKKLVVWIADDENDTKLAGQLADSFAQTSDILAVIGHNATNASMAGAQVYNEQGLVMLTPTSFAADLIGYNQRQKNPFAFRMVPDMVAVSQRLAAQIQADGYDQVAVCTDESAEDNASFGYDFKQIFGTYGTIVDLNCDFAQADFSAPAMLQAMAQQNVEALVMAPHVDRLENGIDLARANAQQEQPLPLYGSPSFYTRITLGQGQADVEGMVLPSLWHPKSSPDHPFLKQAQTLWWGPVNWRTAMSYDATRLIVQGLEEIGRSQPPTRTLLKDYLSDPAFRYDGVTGLVRFKDPSPQNRTIDLLKIRPDPNTPGGYRFDLL